MTYLEQNDVANSPTMAARVAQAAATEGVPDNPDAWANERRREWAAAPGWDAAWASALASHPEDPDFDPGADEAVITDSMILSQVQAMHTEGNTP
jgi:hypothetical protein